MATSAAVTSGGIDSEHSCHAIATQSSPARIATIRSRISAHATEAIRYQSRFMERGERRKNSRLIGSGFSQYADTVPARVANPKPMRASHPQWLPRAPSVRDGFHQPAIIIQGVYQREHVVR